MEEIRLELEDKILNGLLTFDLASRQETPADSEDKSYSRTTAPEPEERNSETASRKSNMTTDNIDDGGDSGDESDLAPQVEALLKRVREGPKFIQDAGEEQLGSEDWPPSDEDAEEGVPDSADEMEVSDEELNMAAREKASPPPNDKKEAKIDEMTHVHAGDGGETGIAGKRYDLGKMAEGGHGGKIMFIFQKVSDGKRKGKA